jgi:hypothetical protein
LIFAALIIRYLKNKWGTFFSGVKFPEKKSHFGANIDHAFGVEKQKSE